MKQVPRTALACEVHGSGTPLVFLHAFPFDRRMWRPQISELAARAKVVAIDLPGFGESVDRQPAGLDAWADLVEATLEALLGNEPVVVCGLSLGGYVAARLAARHPARLAGLALADTRASHDAKTPREQRDAEIAVLEREGIDAFVAPIVPRMFSPHASAELRELARGWMASQRPDRLAGAKAAMRDRPDSTSAIAALDVPARMLVGADDVLSPPPIARQTLAALRRGRLVEIPAAGHLSNLENPAAFNAALADLLDEVEREAKSSSGPTRFVMLTVGRSGSNWLCTLLDSHPEVLCHHEVFNEERIIYAYSRRDGSLDFGTKEARDRDPLAFLERVWAADLDHQAIGFKLCPGQPDEVFEAVLSDPSIRKVILWRRNWVKTYVSRRLAEATGEWESYPEKRLSPEQHRLRVDVADLWSYVAEKERFYFELGASLAERGQVPLWLAYEELAGEESTRLAACRRTLDFLGVEARPGQLEGATRKQNSDDLRDVILDFDQLEAELRGSPLHGDLFEA